MSGVPSGRPPSRWSQILGALSWAWSRVFWSVTDHPSSDPPTTQVVNEDLQQLQQSTTRFSELNDDCLLEIIDRLDYEGRKNIAEVNSRLRRLEKHAKLLKEGRHVLNYCNMLVEKRTAEVDITDHGTESHLFSLRHSSALRILKRVAKTAEVHDDFEIEVHLRGKRSIEIAKEIRFVRATIISITAMPKRTEEGSKMLTESIIYNVADDNGNSEIKLFHPDTWATPDQIVEILKSVHRCQLDKSVEVRSRRIATMKQIALLLMGIDSAPFEAEPTDDVLTSLRTSLKDTKVYYRFRVYGSGRFTKRELKLIIWDGKVATDLSCIYNNPWTEFELITWSQDYHFEGYHRVPSRED